MFVFAAVVWTCVLFLMTAYFPNRKIGSGKVDFLCVKCGRSVGLEVSKYYFQTELSTLENIINK